MRQFFPQRLQFLLPTLGIFSLLGGCAPPSGGGAGAELGGYKDVQIAVNTDQDLDMAASIRFVDGERQVVDFPGQAISSITSGDGVTTVTVRLQPYTDNPEFMPPDVTKYRVTPINPEIHIRSRKLSGISLERIHFTIGIVTSGPQKGEACYLEIPARILRLQPKGSNRATVLSEDTGNGKYSIDQVAIDPKRFSTSKQNIENWGKMTYIEGSKEGQKWDPATSSWLGAPYLYLGDAGGSLYLNSKGWTLEGHAAGPSGSDMSYLETKSDRGDFD